MKQMLAFTIFIILVVCYIVYQSVNPQIHTNALTSDSDIAQYDCGDNPPRDILFLQSQSDTVRNLGQLEDYCDSDITNNLQISLNIPTSTELVAIQSVKLSQQLQDFKSKDLKPLIFFEASSTWTSDNFSRLSRGEYNTYITNLLKTVYDSGIKDEDIFGIVIIPRPNLPNWNRQYLSPVNFKNYYQKVYDNVRKVYPTVDIGMYFSSSTYESYPIDWSNRDYRSLLPYILDIPKEKISIIGVEGYPFVPLVGDKGEVVINSAEYLPRLLIDELVLMINPKNLIISTNTFSALGTDDQSKTVYLPQDMRKQLLFDSISVLKTLKYNNTNVSLLLSNPRLIGYSFADWEYFGTPTTQDTKHKSVLLDFIRELNLNHFDFIFGY